MALKLAHRGYVMETGQITMTGTAAELLTDQRVQDAYLGRVADCATCAPRRAMPPDVRSRTLVPAPLANRLRASAYRESWEGRIVVQHEQLWAPWRLAYVSGEAAAEESKQQAAEPAKLELLPGADPECFICRAVADTDDRAIWLVERTELSVVILNRFPYNNGHLLVAPRVHKGRLDELTDASSSTCSG